MGLRLLRAGASIGLAGIALAAFQNCTKVAFDSPSGMEGSMVNGSLVSGEIIVPLVPGSESPGDVASNPGPSAPATSLPADAVALLAKCAPAASAQVVLLGQPEDPAAQDLTYNEFTNLAPAHAVVASARNVVVNHPGSNFISIQRSESLSVFDFGGTFSAVTRKLTSMSHLAGNAVPVVVNAVEIGNVSDLGLDVFATGQTLTGQIDNASYAFCLSIHDFAASAKVTAGRQFALMGRLANGEQKSVLPLLQTLWGTVIVKDVDVQKIDGFSGTVVLNNAHVHQMTNAWGNVTVYVHNSQIDQIDPSIKIVSF